MADAVVAEGAVAAGDDRPGAAGRLPVGDFGRREVAVRMGGRMIRQERSFAAADTKDVGGVDIGAGQGNRLSGLVRPGPLPPDEDGPGPRWLRSPAHPHRARRSVGSHSAIMTRVRFRHCGMSSIDPTETLVDATHGISTESEHRASACPLTPPMPHPDTGTAAHARTDDDPFALLGRIPCATGSSWRGGPQDYRQVAICG